jgi:hypothetical protein
MDRLGMPNAFMKRPRRVGRTALDLAGLSAIALLLLFPTGEKGERRMAKPRSEIAAAQRPYHSLPIVWRISDLRDATVPGGEAQTFVEVDADDHQDGRKDAPGYALAWHNQQRRIIERQYGHAIASLDLPDTKADKLIDLLTARREAIVDGREAAQQMGIVGPEANVAVRQSVEADTEEIKQLVGSEAYFGTLELAPTISSCKALLESSVGSELAAAGNPLSTDQLYLLAADYVGAVYSPAASEGPQDPDSTTGLTPQYQAFLDKISTRLTPDQVSAFHSFMVKQSQALQISADSSG